MTEARDGDAATYQTCIDPDCPAARPGTEHAHLARVKRADGTTVDSGYAANTPKRQEGR